MCSSSHIQGLEKEERGEEGNSAYKCIQYFGGDTERKQKRPAMSSSCLLHLEQTLFPWRGKRMDSNIPRNIGDIPSGNVSSGKQILTGSLCQGRASPGRGNLFLLRFHPFRAFPPRSSLPFAFPWDSMKEKSRDFE